MKAAAVIGCGAMGAAVVQGLIKSGLEAELRCFDIEPAKAGRFGSRCRAAKDISEAVIGADIVLIAVKPRLTEQVVTEISAVNKKASQNPLIISLAGGIVYADLKKWSDGGRVARIMPNIACLTGQGVIALFAPPEEAQTAADFLGRIGLVEKVAAEEEFAAITGLSGCGPGFVSIIIDALADGGVKMGLSRDRALRLAAQTLIGTAQVVLEGAVHPGELKDMVCSPGGYTIAGVHELEKGGLRAALMSAVEASTKR